MRVTMQTKTLDDPLGVRVVCNEIALNVMHIDKYIHTLQTARRWLSEQEDGRLNNESEKVEPPAEDEAEA